MNIRKLAMGAVAGAAMAAPLAATPVAADVFFPGLTYRTGPFAPGGVPIANGLRDWYQLLNVRDGGIEGVKIDYVECEFGYNTAKGVECYERLKAKNKNMMVVLPFSTGVTYKLVPKARIDKVPILSMGYGMSAAADGRYFPWVFNFPMTYWSQATGIVKYIGAQSGGMAKLKGKKIGFIYLESSYGREPIPIFKALAKRYGYRLNTYSVPGKSMADQRSQWRKIVRAREDYMIMWGWGQMNPTAIQRASEVGFPVNKFIGVWWSGSESDVVPNGKAAIGYRAATFHGTGTHYDFHGDILKHVYNGNLTKAAKNNFGEVLYNRGLFNAMLTTEAVGYAIRKYGKNPTGTHVREGLEKLRLTDARLNKLGMKGFTRPINITCRDHEGNGSLRIQQWDGKQWKMVSDWITPMRKMVRAEVEKAAVAESAKFKYEKRKDCK
ncbi:MAG TPA: ABC transporter substrate-binding protein [Alphaproteobacteria bacterium]|nr:ABC transporter substrate-binding protein [Alphaproteobacteria bacterium]